MRIVIGGSSGLIGEAIRRSCEADGHEVIRLVRRPATEPGEVTIDFSRKPDPDVLSGADAVINLGGASVGGQRWTAAYRRLIRQSRIETTETLAAMAAVARPQPAVFLSASGIRYYGIDRGDEELDESSRRIVDGFLPEVAQAWEKATQAASENGVRVCHLRLGIVLSHRGGALPPLLPYFRMGLGARLGSGQEFWSCLSLNDAVRAVRFLITDPEVSGPYNITAPNPVRNSEFTQALGHVLGRPTFLRFPSWAVEAVLGGVSENVLGSLRVIPQRLLDAGFEFSQPDIDSALRSALEIN